MILWSPVMIFCIFLIYRYLEQQLRLAVIWAISLLAIFLCATQFECTIEREKDLLVLLSISFAITMFALEKRLRSFIQDGAITKEGT